MNENVIIVDADYVDRVTFDLTVNFERMLERRVPPADLARWVECVALDGGLREGSHHTTVVLAHDRGRQGLENFVPGRYAEDLQGQAFSGRLGEFEFQAITGEAIVDKAGLLCDTLQLVLAHEQVKRVVVVPADQYVHSVADVLRRQQRPECQLTLLTMQPLPASPCRQEMLGFSLMAALGIGSDEIDAKAQH